MMIIRTGNIDFYINMFLAKSRNYVCNTGPLFRWTCFQHNRKCCFLLSSCRLLLLILYLCILTSSVNSSFCYLVNIYFSTTSLFQGICRTNIPIYTIYMSAILWHAWFNCEPEQYFKI